MAITTTAQLTSDKITRPFGKGLLNFKAEDNSWSAKMTLRFQTLFYTGYDVTKRNQLENGYSSFLIRRARLKFSGHAFTPKLKYKMELGQSSRDIGGFIDDEHKNAPGVVFDAMLQWNFAKGLYLIAGQTKLPGNRERVISSGSLQMVDRSLLNSKFNIDRDMGVQLIHKWTIGSKKNFLIKEKFALSQGEGRGITVDNIGGFSYTGRLEVYPFGEFDAKDKDDYSGSCLKRQEKPKLVIAGGADFNDEASRVRGNQGGFMRNIDVDGNDSYYKTDVTTIFIDMMFKYKGISLMSEYANRTAQKSIATNGDGTLTGDQILEGEALNIMAGYLFKSNWEVSGRYTAINYTRDVREYSGTKSVTQYTLGVSKYFAGHNLKLQADVSYNQTVSKNDGLLGRIHVEFQL